MSSPPSSPRSCQPGKSPQSYVYPVKSLLAGRIQPAPDLPPQIKQSSSFDSLANLDFTQRQPLMSDSQPLRRLGNITKDRQPMSYSEGDHNSNPVPPSLRRSMTSTSQSWSCTKSNPNDPPARSHGRLTRNASLNFGHFPAGQDASDRPRSSLSSASILMSESESPPLPSIATIAGGSEGEVLVTSNSLTPSSSGWDTSSSASLYDVPTSKSAFPADQEEPAKFDLPFNSSESSIVHLSPLPGSPSSGSDGWSASGTNTSLRDSSHRSSSPLEGSATSFSSGLLHPASGSWSQAISEAQSDTLGSTSSVEPFLTFRFQHAEDEHGNHVVIGREGKLERCEDEPIHTPGAVQAFGVLIAIEESEDTLVVRQVSENSTELLGLPPRFLFSLECFTDTLPDSQAVLLWDNIQSLSESDPSNEADEGSPHVFLLSGWGAPGSAPSEINKGRQSWTCWCAVHRAPPFVEGSSHSGLITMEFELEKDTFNPLYPPVLPVNIPGSGYMPPSTEDSDQTTPGTRASTERGFSPISIVSEDSFSASITSTTASMNTAPDSSLGQDGSGDRMPSAVDILESTTSHSKPLPALERLRRISEVGTLAPYTNAADPPKSPVTSRGRRKIQDHGEGRATVGMMDVFAVIGQINKQFGAATSLDMFLKVVVGVIKDLTQFHRVVVYQFDEAWNGQVVAELVDRNQTTDLYGGLHFPASDIPAQARALYAINKVRLLYDRSQPTARIVVRNKEDLEVPLNMTHCYLRAMSPIHIKYLANMGVRASMSVSIMAFGTLWGLVTCHSYGSRGMRVSFPFRQMLRILSQSISRNIERLSYAQRLHSRKLINTIVSDRHPTGYIVSNTDDLLGLFDADFGILVIGEGAKILGPNQHGQEILIMAEYLRLKEFNTIQASQAVAQDFPDLGLTFRFELVAGLLYVPLSRWQRFHRLSTQRAVSTCPLGREPASTWCWHTINTRASKILQDLVRNCSRSLPSVDRRAAGDRWRTSTGIWQVWRKRESVLQSTKITNLLLSNASHEVRTPLNQIINYLEMALDGPLDGETRDNLSQSHAASKSLLFTINDLLDLTRLESGNATSLNEPFDLQDAISEATYLYRKEAERRSISFILDLEYSPKIVIGDAKKIRTVVQNLTGNSLKYTRDGSVTVRCSTFGEPEGLRDRQHTAVEIVVADTGCGIQSDKLEYIFREFEQVESSEQKHSGETGVGLGLAVVARIVEQLGGQLRVESKADEGSQFSFLIPLALPIEENARSDHSPGGSVRARARSPSQSRKIDSLVEALTSNHMSISSDSSPRNRRKSIEDAAAPPSLHHGSALGSLEVPGSQNPVRPVKFAKRELDVVMTQRFNSSKYLVAPTVSGFGVDSAADPLKLRVLIVEDDKINRIILAKRLRLDGHIVMDTTNGQEGLDTLTSDKSFDAVLMDIQMPILNGFEATQKFRDFEKSEDPNSTDIMRLSHEINGRVPIFAVSASLTEHQREELLDYGMDGWILKPIDFHRLHAILKGVMDPAQRKSNVYRPGCNWEDGGWLRD